MPIKPAINPGTVDWSGENHGILLKSDTDGPFTAMALFFRIAYSPAGRGCALLLYEDPQSENSLPSVRNVMISNNELMARYLVDNFIAKLAAFRDARAFGDLRYVDAVSVRASGGHRDIYSDTTDNKAFKEERVWRELGKPLEPQYTTS